MCYTYGVFINSNSQSTYVCFVVIIWVGLAFFPLNV